MHPDCPFCGAEETRRAHRRTLEMFASLLGLFPFICMQCGARFTVHAVREECRQRERLRVRAVCAGGVCPDATQDAPSVLVTVRTAGPTTDLINLLDQLGQTEDNPSPPAEHRPSPPAIDIKTVAESFGASE